MNLRKTEKKIMVKETGEEQKEEGTIGRWGKGGGIGH